MAEGQDLHLLKLVPGEELEREVEQEVVLVDL
jgi:hypothetical protein